MKELITIFLLESVIKEDKGFSDVLRKYRNAKYVNDQIMVLIWVQLKVFINLF